MCLAIPGQVVEIVDPENRLARVEIAGVRRVVNVGLLDCPDDGAGAGTGAPEAAEPAGARPGDWVLIHVGFALSKIDEAEARATLRLLQGLGEDFEQEVEELRASAIR